MIEILYKNGEIEAFPYGSELEAGTKTVAFLPSNSPRPRRIEFYEEPREPQDWPTRLTVREPNGEITFVFIDEIEEIRAA